MAPSWTFLLFLTFCLCTTQGTLVRKNVDQLHSDEILALEKALREVSDDKSFQGYAVIAGGHGYPGFCQYFGKTVACSPHGDSTFAPWHSLYVVHMEEALRQKGLNIGIPYWDWTKPLTSLPELVKQQVYIDPADLKARPNVWHQGTINITGEIHHTARAVDERLFQKVAPGENTFLFEQVLDALEQDDLCKFFVQYEVAHNSIHFLVGGPYEHSMSTLDFAAYDPIFFLHHSNLNRIMTIYFQILNKRTADTCQGACEFCDFQPMVKPMLPFAFDTNPIELTKTYSTPVSGLDQSVFGFQYDDLTLNGYDVDGLLKLIETRQTFDRSFAAFKLNGIKSSVNVKVKVCVPSDNEQTDDTCEAAGDFFILGGPLEKPWWFSNPYYFDITKTVQGLGVPLESNYYVTADFLGVNGTHLPANVLPAPYVAFRPANGRKDPPISHYDEHEVHEEVVIRKDIDHLTREEIYELREALTQFQADASIDGYQALAEFHGEPNRCPFPTDKERFACVVFGQFNFPHWHRLFIVQFEDALRQRGLSIGVPYWDWSKTTGQLPELVANKTYKDPYTGEEKHNPFYDAAVSSVGNNARTSRDLFPAPPPPAFGDDTILFKALLYALEQDNFCDFEVQLEIIQNAIQAATGGNAPYALSGIAYAAFDPLYYLHHSNNDRIWAIWTALQEYRGLPYKAHCGQSYEYDELKPFSFGAPYNNNKKTKAHSVPTNIYDYEKELGYRYETLEFGGLSIAELDNVINENKKKDRVFVGGLAWSTKLTGVCYVFIKGGGADKFFAGMFAVIGGLSERPWRLDRQYRTEITEALAALGLRYNDPFEVILEPRFLDGTVIPVTIDIPPLSVIFKKGQKSVVHDQAELNIRKNVAELSREEIYELRQAFAKLQADNSLGGFQDLGRYQGSAKWCEANGEKVACGLHGKAAYPHWHRLWTVQAENALRRTGYNGSLPYWEWSLPQTSLPALVADAEYEDPKTNAKVPNPFYSGSIADAGAKTARSVKEELYEQPAFGDYTSLAKQVLYAFEQDNFCDFEVQFEISHNLVHALVGGTETYSVASLEYTAFDPIYYLHRSNADRNWAVWQALQKYRGKTYNHANCAISQMRQPLQPFSSDATINPDAETHDHSRPYQVFDYPANFNYDYDNLDFNGLGIAQLERVLEQNQENDRVFAGFVLHGIKRAALVKIYVTRGSNDDNHFVGEFYILGGPNENPWAFDRLFKYEITDQLEKLEIRYNDRYEVNYEVRDLAGNVISTDAFATASVIFEPGTKRIQGTDYHAIAHHVRKNLDDLTDGEVESLRAAFQAIKKDNTFAEIASYHGKPGSCYVNGRRVACAIQGNPTFPAWNRLYIEQIEQALLAHGTSISVPYWDWTKPFSKLPDLISKPTYFDHREQKFQPNPFFSGEVSGQNAATTRDPQPQLFDNDYLNEQTLLALEQRNFCDFEVQFELIHNTISSWLGGRAEYSVSSQDYAAFDPVYFLHLANTDRIWAIWQELQKYRGLPYYEADCAINLMSEPLQPFHNESLNSRNSLTFKYSRPADTFDYRNHLDYEYDNLNFNGIGIPELDSLLNKRQQHGRIFAGFLLHNVGASVDVDIYVCVPTGQQTEPNCHSKAGSFSVIGGDNERSFYFDRLYRYDITDTVRKLGLHIDSSAKFSVKVDIHAVNGTGLSSDIFTEPTIFFEPGTDETVDSKGKVAPYLVRREINSLSPVESYFLIKALRGLQADSSADGFQSIASFHALPPLCPHPDAPKRWACSRHGVASYPAWHRLNTFQFEDALRRHGSLVGVPYWDWTRVADSLPEFFNEATILDAATGAPQDNPWFGAGIEFESGEIERDIQSDRLFQPGPRGFDSWLFNQALYALEQEDYCDFEVQFEVISNALYSWLGGSAKKSVANFDYAAYDPLFYIHHSNLDRLFAIWQNLQEYRGLNGNGANCALEQLREPLKPFSFGPPYNLNPTTLLYSRPEDTFDYKNHFHYKYDSLDFVGIPVHTLDSYIKDRSAKDRVFAGFLLKSFGSSGLVTFDICAEGNCFEAGHFSVIGGTSEQPWQFDRLFKYEITDVLDRNGLHANDEYEIRVHLRSIDGSDLDSSVIPTPNIIVDLAHKDYGWKQVTENYVRKNVETLTERDLSNLKSALRELKEDESSDGWNAIASFRYQPGSPTWLQWNRLYLLQVEQALRRHGSSVALPYWDWALASSQVPALLTEENYYDAWKNEVVANPFVRSYIASEDTYTVRATVPQFNMNFWNTTLRPLAYTIATAFEAENFCDFAVEIEILSGSFLGSFGGYSPYSLFSLEFGKFDPAYLLAQTFIDKLWTNWQEIQKLNGRQWKTADCALSYLNKPLEPFNDPNVNSNPYTRTHAVPKDLFNNEDLNYAYDNFNLAGFTLEQGVQQYNYLKSFPRVYLGFVVRGQGQNQVHLTSVCQHGNNCVPVSGYVVLGSAEEKPWAYDRLYKLEVTTPLRLLGISPEDVLEPNPTWSLQTVHFDGLGKPTHFDTPPVRVIYKPAEGSVSAAETSSVAGVGVRKEVSTLSNAEIENLKEALRRVKEEKGFNGYKTIASIYGSPLEKCAYNGKPSACRPFGVATFPLWQRLLLKQFEDALTSQGANIGIPYWDWSVHFTELPRLVTAAGDNPFLSGVARNGQTTTRAPMGEIARDAEFGDESFLYQHVLFMFEQTDYCDFEAQFEILSNAMLAWTGGNSPHGINDLEYTAFDPVFLLIQANSDRLLAIWQSLQKYRGLPYNSANCAVNQLRAPLRPFADKINTNVVTRTNSHAADAFDYDRLNYQYDNLNFHGLSIAQLNDAIEERKHVDRIFVEFLIKGVKSSANIGFSLCDKEGHCEFAGAFSVLGGPQEKPWAFDRLYKFDVTKTFKKLNLRPDDEYKFAVQSLAKNGSALANSPVRSPAVLFVPGVKDVARKVSRDVQSVSSKLVRKEVNHLSLAEATNLKNALNHLQQDSGPNGYEAIAGFHGYPFLCPEGSGDQKYACCVYGTPVFPHWTRLLTLQFEQALKAHGASLGIPYWDWTVPGKALPAFFGDDDNNNPFYDYTIASNGQKTQRNISSVLFNSPKVQGYDRIFYLTLQALEEENFCDFEVQFELLNNEIQGLIGGSAQYSLSTLDYSAFDPFFLIHRSAADRVWNVWQTLQKLRGKPFNVARCGGRILEEPLHPFSYADLNKNEFTLVNSNPNTVFDSVRLGYTYDNLNVNGHDVAELNEIIKGLRSETRYFALFPLKGIKTSCTMEGWLIGSNGASYDAFKMNFLGSAKEVPWAYERVYKSDVTQQFKAAGFTTDKPVDIKVQLALYNGAVFKTLEYKSLILERPAYTSYDVLVIAVNTDNLLVPKLVVKKGTRVKFVTDDINAPIENLRSYTVYNECNVPPFSYNNYQFGETYELTPGDYFFSVASVDLCKAGRKIQITVDEE